MGAALGWGSLAAASLVVGAGLAFTHRWPPSQVGLVLSFGAGALISAVSFELTQEALAIGDVGVAGIGLALGALTYYVADGVIASRTASGRGMPGRRGGVGTRPRPRAGRLPRWSAGAARPGDRGCGRRRGKRGPSRRNLRLQPAGGNWIGQRDGIRRHRPDTILRLWIAVAVVCALASVVGFAIADAASSNLQAAIQGFAAGALLVMLIGSMIPEAVTSFGRTAGLVTTLGFALATALSSAS